MKVMTRENQQLNMLVLADFTGGMNSAVPPQVLQDNEFQLIRNMEFSFNQLVTRGGTHKLMEFDHNIKAFYKPDGADVLIVVLENGDVYYGGATLNKVGVVAGNETPVFCGFDGNIFVATGGKLQYVKDDREGVTFNTIESSFICDNVFERFGRLVTTKAGDDYMRYSAVGDPYETGWEDDSNDDSTSKWLEIGYKDDGDIITALPIAGDIAVFKTNGRVYSVSGEYPNWNVQLIAEHTDVKNKEAIKVVGSDIVFNTSLGLKSLQSTAVYGNFGVNEIARKINRNIVAANTSSLYNLVRKRQLIIVGDSPSCFTYAYDLGAGVEMVFPFEITYMQDTEEGVLIAHDGELCLWSQAYADDDGEPVQQTFVSKQYESTGRYYTRRVDFGIKGTAGDKVYFEWANKRIPYEINELRRVKQVFSVCRDSSIRFDTQAKIAIDYIKLYLFEGV